MGRVRALTESDISQVRALHERTFASTDKSSSDALQSYLVEIFFRNPWYDETLPSLVYEDDQGRVIGCLGVMPRPMCLNGRPIRAAVSHNFMVAPEKRSTMAAVALVKKYLAGPQDLSLADSTSSSRKIWERFGGQTALLYSLRWNRLIRPVLSSLSFLERRGLPVSLRRIMRPFCALLDAVAVKIPRTGFRQVPPSVRGEDLEWPIFLAHVSNFFHDRSLLPKYDERSLQWLFQVLVNRRLEGRFRKVVIRDVSRQVLGWYLYYLNPKGIGEVVQIAATRSSIGEVLDHLFYDAWKNGANALSGQFEPAFLEAFCQRYCFLNHGGFWVLVHSRNQQLLNAIHRGDAFLTRLEGESWMRLAFQ